MARHYVASDYALNGADFKHWQLATLADSDWGEVTARTTRNSGLVYLVWG